MFFSSENDENDDIDDSVGVCRSNWKKGELVVSCGRRFFWYLAISADKFLPIRVSVQYLVDVTSSFVSKKDITRLCKFYVAFVSIVILAVFANFISFSITKKRCPQFLHHTSIHYCIVDDIIYLNQIGSFAPISLVAIILFSLFCHKAVSMAVYK